MREISYLRAAARLIRLAMHIFYGVLMTMVYRLRFGRGWYDMARGKCLIQDWMRRACHILGINIHVKGQKSPVQDTLYVANHISWIDIIALSSVLDVKFISKKTVKYWPIIGWLAAAIGTLFISRGKHFALNGVIDKVRRELDRCHAILLFPEGTTTDGRQVGRFHASLFKAVSETEHLVQPVSLRYQRQGQLDRFAPYIGGDNFVFHLFRIASLTETHLVIEFTPLFEVGNMSRQEIAETAYDHIVTTLVDDCPEQETVAALLVA